MGRNRHKPRLRIARAVRHFCWECQGRSWKAVSACENMKCALWEHRSGRRPSTAIIEQAQNVPVEGCNLQNRKTQEAWEESEPASCDLDQSSPRL